MPNPRRSPGATDIRNQPSYSLGEAARYLKLPPATLRSWVVGRPYPTSKGMSQSRALITPAASEPTMLCFWNLIEAHVLRSLRTEHGVPLREVRAALDFAGRKLGIERLLLREELRTSARQLFLDHYGKLLNLSASGQLALQWIFDAHLQRVAWDKWRYPIRLYPFLAVETVGKTGPIAIDPTVAFGRPVLVSRGISTQAIADRIDAGETVNELATDYELTPNEIEQAVLYERAA